MVSLNAQKVAIKVSEKVCNNELVNLGEIIQGVGYSKSVSRRPKRVTETLSYKKSFELATRPLLEGIQKEISRIKDALANKNYDEEETRVLAGTLDILLKNQQLLSSSLPKDQNKVSLLDDRKKALLDILNDNA